MSISDILSWAGTLGFIGLGVSSMIGWVRSKERVTLYLALALSLLGAVSLAGRLNEITDYAYPVLADISLIGFLASGYFLLLFRHRFLPLPRTTLLVVGGLVAVTALLVLIADPPPGGVVSKLDNLQAMALLMVVGLWTGCVAEPVFRFWIAARHKPRVQRSRLRALSVGYGGIILILIFVVAAHPKPDSATSVGLNLFTFLLVPILYVSFAPPRWLRRAWHETRDDSLLFQDLADFAPDRRTIARRALDRATRLVGAEAGYILDTDASVLAQIDLSDGDIEKIEELRSETGRETMTLNATTHAISLPLHPEPEAPIITVVSGPFTPLFGSDERTRLKDYCGIVGVALDRVRLVEALASETDRYQALLQAISDVGEGFVITEEGRCVYANDAYISLTGYSLPELQAMASLSDLGLPEERLSTTNAGDASTNPDNDHYETQLRRKDGDIKHVEVAVKMLKTDEGPRVISLVRDITERKVSEEQLRSQTEAIRLLQRIAIAANEAHELDEVLAIALREICEYSGWPVGHVYIPSSDMAGQLIPSGIWHLADPDRFSTFRRITDETRLPVGSGLAGEVLETGRPLWISDIRADPRFERGPDVMVRAGFAFPVLVGREVAGVLEFFTDEVAEPDDGLLDVVTNIGTQLGRVVERKRIESLRGEFISNAAHELRTPITTIVGFSSLLSEDSTLTQTDTKNAVTALNRQADRLKTLVNNLLDFTRMQERRLEADLDAVSVLDAMRNAVDAILLPEDKEVEIVGGNDLIAMADKLQLEQILTNLVVNALRYGGDRISLSVEEGGPEEVILTVTDNGPGVPRELAGRLFEPFSRGPHSASQGGTGLGLAIVRMLAHAQGGDVVYRPAPDGGARFEVHLRRATDAA